MAGQSPNTICTGKVGDPAAGRTANGVYTNAFRNSIPLEAQTTAGLAIQALTHTETTTAPFATGSPEETLMAAPDTLAFGTIGVMVSILEKFPDQSAVFRPKLLGLMATNGISQGNTNLIKMGLDEMARLSEKRAKGDVTTPTTTAEFVSTQTPRVALFQTICKSVERGSVAIPMGTEMLDVATGKKMIPFEKATKVTSGGNLMYALHVFVITIMGLLKESFKVYDGFFRDCNLVCESRGYLYCQEYASKILEVLDMKLFPNMPALYRHGDHNRVASLMAGTHNNVGGQGLQYDQDYNKDFHNKDFKNGDLRKKIDFGPVTKPMGGEGAGVITNWKTKAKSKCNKYHATPRQSCTAGIPAGDTRFKADQIGLCAYEH